MKNYIGFVNDHSGSMTSLREAAVKDYNDLIKSIRVAASAEMQDTIVSAYGIGCAVAPVVREICNSNPHVLKPINGWEAYGNTPLYDGIGSLINLFESMPDADDPNVSFLVFVTTDGGENASKNWSHSSLEKRIKALQNKGNWTFVFRVPQNYPNSIVSLGIPRENIQTWETTTEGMSISTVQTQAAVSGYFRDRSAGARSSSSFYSNAAAVDTSALTDITKEVSLYKVGDNQMGIEIRDFILKHRMEYLKGAAFYQLTKTEPRVQHNKMVAIRDRKTGAIYAGDEARKMIGLPTNRNARLHPGDHGNYDIFIQSESVNRKLVAGTGVLYWPKIGVPFTEEDLTYLKPKQKASGPVELPKVTPTNKPTKSPIPVARKPKGPHVDGKPVRFFPSRREARNHARMYGKSVKDLMQHTGVTSGSIYGDRWYVFE